jgi:hypothetical protein
MVDYMRIGHDVIYGGRRDVVMGVCYIDERVPQELETGKDNYVVIAQRSGSKIVISSGILKCLFKNLITGGDYNRGLLVRLL